MSIQQVNLGNYANDGQGDDLRTAFEKYNVSVSDLDQTRVVGADNLGAGAPIYVDKVDKNLKFRSIKQGGTPGNVLITYNDNEVIIAVRDAIGRVEDDPSPALGGNLNLNTHGIVGLGAIDVTGNITADKFFGVLDGDVIVNNSTLTLRAVNTTSQNYNAIFLNGFEITGNNVQHNGTSVFATHSGDDFRLSSGGDLDITAESGKINITQPDVNLAAGGVRMNVDGTVTSTGFIGPLTGNVTGVITGLAGSNINGNVTGIVNGLAGSSLIGSVTGDVLGNLTGNVLGNLVGSTTGTHIGPVTGTVSDISNHVLADLGDVAATVPATGYVLKWNGSQWAAAPESGGSGSIPTDYDFGIINVSVTNPIELLLQASIISFGTFTEPSNTVWDLGPIAGVETNPTYTLSRSAASIAEGASATITLTTTNVNDGVSVPYVVTGTGIASGDFTTFTLTGNLIVNAGTATVTIDTASDVYIEGTEVMTFTLAGISPTKNITISIADNTPMDGGGPSTSSFTDTSDGGSPSVSPTIEYDGGPV